jgi:hypothetical protein
MSIRIATFNVFTGLLLSALRSHVGLSVASPVPGGSLDL